MFNLFRATTSRVYEICHRGTMYVVHGWRETTNHGMRLQATWPSGRKNLVRGWLGWGIIYNFQKKEQGLKYRNLPLHQSILTEVSTFPLFILRVKLSTPTIHTKQCLYNDFTVQCLQYNICSTISVVQFLQYNICSTTILQSTPYLGWLSIDAWGVETCIFSFTPVYAKSCICYVSVKTARPLHFR